MNRYRKQRRLMQTISKAQNLNVTQYKMSTHANVASNTVNYGDSVVANLIKECHSLKSIVVLDGVVDPGNPVGHRWNRITRV